MQYVSAIFVDFDNIYGCLYRQFPSAAKSFANEPAFWLDALRNMRGNEQEETSHNFVVRRCYMNPAGLIQGDNEPFSRFRQHFVRDGWEVIDTPPLTSRGKTSADIQIVMDIMDAIAHFEHVGEYVIMAADADYTPIVIRLRKHMKKTVVYAATNTAVAYRAACDSIIDEKQFIELFHDTEVPVAGAPVQADSGRSMIAQAEIKLDDVRDKLQRHFEESGLDYNAPLPSIGHLLMNEFGKEISKDWLGYKTLRELVRHVDGADIVAENRQLFVRLRRSSPAAALVRARGTVETR
jgi:NYN domain-containing protein